MKSKHRLHIFRSTIAVLGRTEAETEVTCKPNKSANHSAHLLKRRNNKNKPCYTKCCKKMVVEIEK